MSTRNERMRETEDAIDLPERRLPTPQSRVQRLIGIVEATRGPEYVASWLSDRTCEFGATTIFTTGAGVDRLRHDFSRLAKSLGVSIEFDLRQEHRLRRANADVAAAKRKGAH